MQDLSLLNAECADLRSYGWDASLLLGDDPWSPVTAVRLAGLRLPPAVRPRQVEVEILLPDLFGFAADASVAVLGEHVHLDDGAPLPFAGELDAPTAAPHTPYLPALRGRARERVLGRPFLCLLPEQGAPERYHHEPLAAFVVRLLDFLSGPVTCAEADLTRCREAWRRTGSPWWLRRLGHALEGLGRIEEAREVFRSGELRFAHRSDLAHHAERLSDDTAQPPETGTRSTR